MFKLVLEKAEEPEIKLPTSLDHQKSKRVREVNHELPDVQARFRKGRGTRDQIANILWIIKKAREFEKNIYFCFIDYAIAFDCVDHNKLWKILKYQSTWPASWETYM